MIFISLVVVAVIVVSLGILFKKHYSYIHKSVLPFITELESGYLPSRIEKIRYNQTNLMLAKQMAFRILYYGSTKSYSVEIKAPRDVWRQLEVSVRGKFVSQCRFDTQHAAELVVKQMFMQMNDWVQRASAFDYTSLDTTVVKEFKGKES